MLQKALSLVAVLTLAGSLPGCAEQSPGIVRTLGATNPSLAFATAKDVISQYYDIESADPATREITCKPKMIQAPNERLLGGSPTRQVAKMRLFPMDNSLAAQVSIVVQRQGSSVIRAYRSTSKYNSVPDETPVDVDAATTPEQNEVWQPAGYDHDTERKILEDLYIRLHPDMLGQPATVPAG